MGFSNDLVDAAPYVLINLIRGDFSPETPARGRITPIYRGRFPCATAVDGANDPLVDGQREVRPPLR